MTCATCGEPTANVYRLCDPCRVDKTRAECESSSVPFVIADPVANARLAQLLLPSRERVAS